MPVLFLYREVLQVHPGDDINAFRARRHKRIPVVLSVEEARRVIDMMDGAHRLMTELLYGAGLRLNGGRWHVHASVLQKAVKQAAEKTGIRKRVTPHCCRHSFATHLLEAGYNIRAVQELMGHKSVETTMIYTHVMSKGENAVRSPLDIFS